LSTRVCAEEKVLFGISTKFSWCKNNSSAVGVYGRYIFNAMGIGHIRSWVIWIYMNPICLRVTCFYSRNYITKISKKNGTITIHCFVLSSTWDFEGFFLPITICDKYIVLNKYNQFIYVVKSTLDDMVVSLPNSQ
jgi:hypothetical protein